jgi:hypothetical protein
MAQIELRNATIRLKDGFGGSAAVNDTIMSGDSAFEIDTVADLTDDATVIYPGARLTVVGSSVTHTVTASNGNEVFEIDVDGSMSGTFTVTVNGQTTTAQMYNDSAANVEADLEALSTVGAGNVSVEKVGDVYTIEFIGDLANTELTVSANLASLMGGMSPAAAQVHNGGTTWELTVAPAFTTSGTGIPSTSAVITFLPAQVDVKIGDGNLTWTEAREFEYVLDRGDLDTVKEGDQQPMEVNIDFVYEFYSNGSGGEWNPSPIDFLKRAGEAANLSNTSSDPCEPFACDIELFYDVPCGSEQDETITFPDFRYESLEFDLGEATISVGGRCNATQPISVRS